MNSTQMCCALLVAFAARALYSERDEKKFLSFYAAAKRLAK